MPSCFIQIQEVPVQANVRTRRVLQVLLLLGLDRKFLLSFYRVNALFRFREIILEKDKTFRESFRVPLQK
jgi:hypothetical protein